MAKRIMTATEKTTGRTWSYTSRNTYGRREFRFPLFDGQWAPTLKLAKEMAKQANRFRYDGDVPLITIVED